MKIVALDVATRIGIAAGETGGKPTAWSEDLGKGLDDDQRFANALRLTDRLMREHAPELVAVEAPIGGRDTSHYLVGLAAIVRSCAAVRGASVVSYHSGSVRKHFLGKALTARDFPSLSKAAAKKAIKAEVQKRCRVLGWGELDGDAADAAALFDYASALAGARVSPSGELFT